MLLFGRCFSQYLQETVGVWEDCSSLSWEGQLEQKCTMVCIDGFCSFRQEIRAEGLRTGWCSQGGGTDTEAQTQQVRRLLLPCTLVPTWPSLLVQDTSFFGPQVLHLSQGCDLPTPPTTQAIVSMKQDDGFKMLFVNHKYRESLWWSSSR